MIRNTVAVFDARAQQRLGHSPVRYRPISVHPLGRFDGNHTSDVLLWNSLHFSFARLDAIRSSLSVARTCGDQLARGRVEVPLDRYFLTWSEIDCPGVQASWVLHP